MKGKKMCRYLPMHYYVFKAFRNTPIVFMDGLDDFQWESHTVFNMVPYSSVRLLKTGNRNYFNIQPCARRIVTMSKSAVAVRPSASRYFCFN